MVVRFTWVRPGPRSCYHHGVALPLTRSPPWPPNAHGTTPRRRAGTGVVTTVFLALRQQQLERALASNSTAEQSASASVIERVAGASLNARRRTSQLHTWTRSAAVGPVRPVRVAPQDRGQLPYRSAGEGPQPPASSVARTDPSVAQRALKTPSIVLMGGAGMAATAVCRVSVWVFEKTDQAHDVSIVLVHSGADSQPSRRPGYEDKVDRCWSTRPEPGRRARTPNGPDARRSPAASVEPG